MFLEACRQRVAVFIIAAAVMLSLLLVLWSGFPASNPSLSNTLENSIRVRSNSSSSTQPGMKTSTSSPGQYIVNGLRPPHSLLDRIKAMITAGKSLSGSRIIDAYPWIKAPASPYPAYPFSVYMPLSNITMYLRRFYTVLVKAEETLYTFYMLPDGVGIIVLKTTYNNTRYYIVYGFIHNITAWASRLAEFSVLVFSQGKTCEEALAGLARIGLSPSKTVILRIPFPWAGGAGEKNEALVLAEIPVLGGDWPISLRLINEKMDWSLIVSPAIYYALNKTLPQGTPLSRIYVDIMPRIVRAVLLPGVRYYSATKLYETPLMLRMTGMGVCKDYAYASAFLADSLGLIAVDSFGVDPRTGINHSLSALIVPSSMNADKGLSIIPDIDGDGKKEYFVPLVDTAKIPPDMLIRGGFTKKIIVDPGIAVAGMDPYHETIDYHWYIQYFIGLEQDYLSLPQPFRPPWASSISREMLDLDSRILGISPNITRYMLRLIQEGLLIPTVYSWFAGNPYNLSDAIYLSIHNGVLDPKTYAPIKWIGVFTLFYSEKIKYPNITVWNPVIVGSTHHVPSWFWDKIYISFIIGANNASNVLSNFLFINVKPVFKEQNGIYVLTGYYGEKKVNGTTYSVLIKPTSHSQKQLCINVMVNNTVKYIEIIPAPPTINWSIIIDKRIGSYYGIDVTVGESLDYFVGVALNETRGGYYAKGEYREGPLYLKYYVGAAGYNLTLKIDVIGGFPAVRIANITVYFQDSLQYSFQEQEREDIVWMTGGTICIKNIKIPENPDNIFYIKIDLLAVGGKLELLFMP